MDKYVSMVHGLAAYHKPQNEHMGGAARAVYQRAKDTLRLQDGEEICVADRLIGPIGILVRGKLRVLASEDCWSNTERDKRRYPTDTEDVAFIEDEEGLCEDDAYWFAMLSQLLNGKNDEGQYVEGFMAYPRIQEVWIKRYAMKNKEWRRAAHAIAKHYGVKIRVVERATKVWQLWPLEDPEFRRTWQEGYILQEGWQAERVSDWGIEGLRLFFAFRFPHSPIHYLHTNKGRGDERMGVHKRYHAGTWYRRGEDPETDPRWWG